MKNSTKLFIVFLVFCFSSTAHALTINYTGNVFDSSAPQFTIDGVNIGYVDVIIASSDAKNNPDELTFLQTVLGTEYTLFSKDEGMGDSSIDPYPWVEADDFPNVVAYEFDPYFGLNPDYFLLKFGNGAVCKDCDSSFIFKNVANLNFAVIDLDAFGENVDMYAISHMTAPVPEPSTILLLGCGLLGLGWYGRKRKKV